MTLLRQFWWKKERKVLIFFGVTLVPMTLHNFFVGNEFNEIFFVKEYFQLITCAYICYFYLYQMYLLFEKHSFLTYFGLFCIVTTVIYISVIGVYFSVATAIIGPSIFYCSNPVWLMITAAGFTFSIIFISIGVVVHKNLEQKSIMYKEEVMKKVKNLWVLIFTYVFSAILELISFAVFMGLRSRSCILEIDNSLPATIILFIFLRALTDYPLLTVVLYQFWQSLKKEKKQVVRLYEESERVSKLSEVSNFKFTLGDFHSSHNFTN